MRLCEAFWISVRLKPAQKKMTASGTSFCHTLVGSGKFASMVASESPGTCAGPHAQRLEQAM